VIRLYLGASCYIDIHTGNSSYADSSTLAADAAGSCHDNVLCSITLTNPVRYYNDRLLNVMSQDDDDDDDDSHDDDDGRWSFCKLLLLVICTHLMACPVFVQFVRYAVANASSVCLSVCLSVCVSVCLLHS